MKRTLGHLSRLLNWLSGGEYPETLCSRIGRVFGPRCYFCRFIGWVLSEPEHCQSEIVNVFPALKDGVSRANT